MTTPAARVAGEGTTTSEFNSQVADGRLDHEAAAAYLGELHDTHRRAVLGLCRTLLRDATEAEDALQATFLLAFRSLLKGTVPREPGAWIATIARNECWGRVRSRMREPLLTSEPEEIPGGDDPLAVAIGNEDVGMFWAAFRELPGPQQRAFLLREFGGLSYDELALALGVSGPAVESLLFRARRGLRTSLATVAALPLALRDLLAQFGTGAAATGVAVKAATVTAGVGLMAVTVTGLQPPHHHATHAPREAAAPVHVRRVAVHKPTAVAAVQFRSASAGRRPRRLAPVSATPVAFVPDKAVNNQHPRGEVSQTEVSDEASPPAQQSVPAPPVREEAVAPESDNKPSGGMQTDHQNQQTTPENGGDGHGDGGSSGGSGGGGD